jgi:hypothetical protein
MHRPSSAAFPADISQADFARLAGVTSRQIYNSAPGRAVRRRAGA